MSDPPPERTMPAPAAVGIAAGGLLQLLERCGDDEKIAATVARGVAIVVAKGPAAAKLLAAVTLAADLILAEQKGQLRGPTREDIDKILREAGAGPTGG